MGWGEAMPETTDPRAAFVTFSAQIGPETADALFTTVLKLISPEVDASHLLLSTPGGSVMNGITLYNLLRGLPTHLVTHNVGNVDSIGNAVFLAGAERFACPQATFMFHGVGQTALNERLDERRLREGLESVLADQDRIGAIIEDRTSLTREEIAPLFTTAQTKDAGYALDAGIIHDIREVHIPADAPVVALQFDH
jgi:ATP-dependent protease ClpP protease subunit